MPKKNMTGQRFGRLEVSEYVYYDKKKQAAFWKCLCDCGNEKIVSGVDLRRGHAKSCGCLNVDAHKTHGKLKTRLYKIWSQMKYRCHDQDNKDYGGRGIKVCDEWKDDFMAFHKWATSNGYNNNLTIDRIDNDGGYEPSNCRWITRLQQESNKRTNVFVEHLGKQVTLSELAKAIGVSRQVIWQRYRRGDRGARLSRPIKK